MNKTVITKQNFLILDEGLEKVSKIKKVDIDFSYAVARTFKLNNLLKNSIVESINPSENYNKFKEELKKLAVEYCKKDDNNNISIVNVPYQEYEIINKEDFENSKKELKLKYKEDIEDWEYRRKQINNFILKEDECVIYSVSEDHLPENIDFDSVFKIFPIIKFNGFETIDTEVDVSNCIAASMLIEKWREVNKPIFIKKLAFNFKQMISVGEKIRKENKELFDRQLEYEQKRIEIGESNSYHNILDEVQSKYNNKIKGFEYYISDTNKFQKEFEALKIEYKDCIDEIEKILKGETTVPICKIKKSEYPENDINISTDMLMDIFFMMEDEDNEEALNKPVKIKKKK